MAIGQRVQLLRDIEVPASGDMRPLRKTMGGFVRSRTIHRGEFVSVIRASNQPQDEPNAIRYWVDLPELRNDAIGVPLYDGDYVQEDHRPIGSRSGPPRPGDELIPKYGSVEEIAQRSKRLKLGSRMRVIDMERREENPGVREIGRHIYDYASARQFLLGRGNVRKLANNTSVERISDHAVNRMMMALKESASDVIAVVLHNTYIVAYTSDGRILLNSGSYQTTTTKQRMNQLLPPGYGVTQRDYAWYVRTPNGEYPFEDGAILYPGAIMEYETP